MSEKHKLTAAQWVDALAHQELPAITSVASMLDKFANDDTSSIPQLSKAILHDQALSSRLLQVVNTTQHATVSKVTTVSRAAIVLGIQAVKNICLTAKILEGLLQTKNLSPPVYERLLSLMANAFYAGLLAKMMLPNYQDDTAEEVYLAAMLYHIGETAFWSTGNETTERLIHHCGLTPEAFEQHCVKELGFPVQQLSAGLAKTWNLGDLLLKSLDNPHSRTIEMQVISLANALSAALNSPSTSKSQLNRVLSDVGRIMKIDQRQLEERINQTRSTAVSLLSSYGASILEKHILSIAMNNAQRNISDTIQPSMSTEKAIIQTLQQLNKQLQAGDHINALLATAIQQSAKIFQFDSCAFWMLTGDKQRLELRSDYDALGDSRPARLALEISGPDNLFSAVIRNKQPILVNDPQHAKWHSFINAELARRIHPGVIGIVPVLIGDKPIGLLTAQLLTAGYKIAEEAFTQFSFIAEHLNLCLTLNTSR